MYSRALFSASREKLRVSLPWHSVAVPIGVSSLNLRAAAKVNIASTDRDRLTFEKADRTQRIVASEPDLSNAKTVHRDAFAEQKLLVVLRNQHSKYSSMNIAPMALRVRTIDD